MTDIGSLPDDERGSEVEDYTGQIPRMLRDTVKSLLKNKAKEKDITLRQAMQYAGGEVSAEESASRQAVDTIAAKLGLEPSEVLEFWNGRTRTVQRAFYRDGTFIVIENLPDALAKAPRVKP